MTQENAVSRTAAMYRILNEAGVNIIRVGLKSSDLMDDHAAGGTFHPAFRQLVEGRIAREDLERQLLTLYPQLRRAGEAASCCPAVSFISNSKSYNNMFGHQAVNRQYFAEHYPDVRICWQTDAEVGITVPAGSYRVMASHAATREEV